MTITTYFFSGFFVFWHLIIRILIYILFYIFRKASASGNIIKGNMLYTCIWHLLTSTYSKVKELEQLENHICKDCHSFL